MMKLHGACEAFLVLFVIIIAIIGPLFLVGPGHTSDP